MTGTASTTLERDGAAPAALQRLSADTIRILAAECVQRANSGHPGMPMGMADAATVLWSQFLKHDPTEPTWFDRDRFVLSAGHGSMLLYALLHLSGYDLSLDELQRFRQLHSKTPGHPEYGLTPGVETTTGPLGQGLGNAVGMALAERWLAERYNRPDFAIVDHYTYVIASDGDLMEGISHEVCSLAGHLGLSKLIVLYDDNGISIDGPTALAFSEDVLARFAAYGWHVQRVDGHDPDEVEAALTAARSDNERPSLIACRTRIGFGSPGREGSSKAHGEPLGVEEVQRVKERLGWTAAEEFHVPNEARIPFQRSAARGRARRAEWQQLLARYTQQYPAQASELRVLLQGELPEGWQDALPAFDDKPRATRAASGAVLDALAGRLPMLIGGSADLTPSNNTQPKGDTGRALSGHDFSGRYIHFGVREHGMGAILNGMALHGGMRPYGGTFLVFADYMRSPIRMAALMGAPVIFVFTHDSVGLGEDGPTHQPIEHLTGLRAIPNLVVLRPADATETVEAWRVALERTNGPSALILTRQAVPTLDRTILAPAAGTRLGAYVLSDAADFEAIIMATGSEVQLALQAQAELRASGRRVRVVSMPAPELFERQDASYRENVLPARVRARVCIEAGATLGWGKYVGLDGEVVGIDRFGASAPAAHVFQDVGVTAQAVVAAVLRVLDTRAP